MPSPRQARQDAAKARREDEERQLREAEEQERRQREQQELEAKEKMEAIRKEKEAQKRALKKERKSLRTVCKDHDFYADDGNNDMKVQHMAELDKLCEVLGVNELEQLNKQLEAGNGTVQVFYCFVCLA